MRSDASVRRQSKMAVAVSNRWYFTKEQLENTPSIRAGLDPEKELSYRQQAATLIQDMGQRLSVSQLTINTAIVYMHRFYMYHCFSKFHRNVLAPCCLFLAAKVEEQPRKLEHVITVAHRCLHRGEQPLDIQSEEYMQKAQDLVENESILLQTLGFECTVHHPHTYVVKCIQLVRASKDLGQTSYFMATNSLHLTTLCLQYKPPVVACACIHLACKWSNWEIPQSSDNKNWWEYIDSSVNKDLLDEIAQEFIHILDKCPSRLKKKIHSVPGSQPIRLPRTDHSSSKASNSTSSGSSSATRTTAQNNVDGAQNGVGGSESLAHMFNELEKGRQREKEQSLRDERERSKDKRQEPDKLKPLPAIASVHSVSGSTAVSTMVTLPPLLPLTTKYATVTAASQMPIIGDAKVLPSVASGSVTSTMLGLHGKHKHHLQSDVSPAKKHKSSHSHRPHSSSQKSKTSDTALASSKVPHSHKSSSHSHKRPNPQSGHHGAVSSHSSHKPHSSHHHHHTLSSHKTHHGHTHRPSSKSSADLAKRHSSSSRSESQTKSQAMEPPPPPPPPVATDSSLPLPPASLSTQQRFLAPVTGVVQNPMAATVGQLPMSFMPSMFPGMLQGQAMVSQQESFGVNSHRAQGINPFGVGQISSVVTGVTPPPPPPPGPGPMSPPPPPPPPLP